MRSPQELAETEAKVRNYIAQGMPDLSHVECMRCGLCQSVTHAVDLGQFLAVGWPKCHGNPMKLFTRADAAKHQKE